jgi:drug/metabolite transporter (DMT)-like permease
LSYWRYFSFNDIGIIIQTNLPYLIAQFLLFSAIKMSDSSVVSPLLVLKIPALACISILLFDKQLEPLQWGAIAIIVYLAYSISTLSGKLEIKPVLLIMGACICYGISDLGITSYTKNLGDLPLQDRIFIAITINYMICALVMLPFVRLFKVPLKAIGHMKWSAITWLVAVALLVVGFSLSGVVEANVAQSTRGVIAVFIGYVAIRLSNNVFTDKRQWHSKMIVSSLMVAGVALFYL